MYERNTNFISRNILDGIGLFTCKKCEKKLIEKCIVSSFFPINRLNEVDSKFIVWNAMHEMTWQFESYKLMPVPACYISGLRVIPWIVFYVIFEIQRQRGGASYIKSKKYLFQRRCTRKMRNFSSKTRQN